ncbi:Peptidase aspartic, catalytic [Cordyceps javanica]|uniref:Peptidase aspartic, catalytic n=1 Tax=Cordyceps javanica TaxID=43265 RepID=A0A545V9T9_9HYPO|nr:Peptidase aspartic, catalytic [Cordyceps javanica]TQW09708.1 Peptidase aspartic, catalytic [Cordyceps javanica]
MKKSWQISLLLAAQVVTAQRVVQRSVQHFESPESGPFLPFITLGFGTPAQNITGVFDTGSSDVIIPEAGSAVCRLKTQQCTAPAAVVRGQFDPEAASDVRRLAGKRFNATFGGGDQYDGVYIKTTVTLGNNGAGKVPRAQVALASHSKPRSRLPQVPVFGIGPRPNEATEQRYDNLPKKMKVAGTTKSQAYSVVLNATPFGNGSVFFGGIDRSKFSGQLKAVPLERDNRGEVSEFVVRMSSVKLRLGARRAVNGSTGGRQCKGGAGMKPVRTKRAPWARATSLRRENKANVWYGKPPNEVVDERAAAATAAGQVDKHAAAGDGRKSNKNNGGGGGGNRNSTTAAGAEINLGLDPADGLTLVDTGGVEMGLPAPVLARMARALGAAFSERDGLGAVECARLPGSELVMRFRNDTVEARVPLGNMRVSEALLPDGKALARRGLCVLAVGPARPGGLSTATLPFLAAVYTVFDLDNDRLLFAQARGDPGAPGGRLEEFPPKKDSRGKGKKKCTARKKCSA